MFGNLIALLNLGLAAKDVARKADADYEQREQAKKYGNATYISHDGTRATSTNERVYRDSRNYMVNGHNAVVGLKSGKIYADYTLDGAEYINAELAKMGCPFKFKECKIQDKIHPGHYYMFWVPYNHVTHEYYQLQFTRPMKYMIRPDVEAEFKYFVLKYPLEYAYAGYPNETLRFKDMFNPKKLTANEFKYYGGVLTSTIRDGLLMSQSKSSCPYELEDQRKIFEEVFKQC